MEKKKVQKREKKQKFIVPETLKVFQTSDKKIAKTVLKHIDEIKSIDWDLTDEFFNNIKSLLISLSSENKSLSDLTRKSSLTRAEEVQAKEQIKFIKEIIYEIDRKNSLDLHCLLVYEHLQQLISVLKK